MPIRDGYRSADYLRLLEARRASWADLIWFEIERD